MYRFTLLLLSGVLTCSALIETAVAQAPQADPIGVTVKKTKDGPQKGTLQVVSVTVKSLGGQLNLLPGDLLLRINNRNVESQVDLMRALYREKTVSLLIHRNGKPLTIDAEVFWPGSEDVKAFNEFAKKNNLLTTDTLPPVVISPPKIGTPK